MTDGNDLDREEALFLSIMYSFHAAAMQQMGKIANPFTGKVERDLPAARGTVDVLLMFQKKTAGNLTDRERRVLNNLVTELQLNYVDESQRAPEAPAAEPEAPAAAAPEPAAEPEAAATPEAEKPAETSAAAEAPPAAATEEAAEPETHAEEEAEAVAPAAEEAPPKAEKKKKKKPAGGKKKEAA